MKLHKFDISTHFKKAATTTPYLTESEPTGGIHLKEQFTSLIFIGELSGYPEQLCTGGQSVIQTWKLL